MGKSILICAVLSMLPLSELRGAIVYGTACALPLSILYPVCVAANLLPVPLIMLFLRRILGYMQDRGGKLKEAADRLLERGKKKSAIVKKYELLGLFVLVAIPLPGTGAWTGALVAALLGRRMRHALPVIALGVMAAGALMCLACAGVIHIAGL